MLSQGTTVALMCKKIGVTDQTYYRWRKEYGGMRVNQARRLKELEQEKRRRLKKVVADFALDCSPTSAITAFTIACRSGRTWSWPTLSATRTWASPRISMILTHATISMGARWGCAAERIAAAGPWKSREKWR